MGSGSESDYLKSLGAKVKEARKAKGLSLRKLAALCRIDHSDIGKLEKGKTNSTILTLLEVARALEIHPKVLFDFEIEFED